MKTIKVMLLGITIALLGIASGVATIAGGGDVFEAIMVILVPVGFIITIIGFIKKDNGEGAV